MQIFSWPKGSNSVCGYSGSDGAGGIVTRKNTSGGVCMARQHVIKLWSFAPRVVAWIPAEFELYALLKCSCQVIGLMSFAEDFGAQFNSIVHFDASVAFVVAQAQGLGKFRHMRVQWLWLQDQAKEEIFELRKVNGEENPADFMTKHLAVERPRRFLTMMNLQPRSGRASKSLNLGNLRNSRESNHNDQGLREGESRGLFVTRK